MNMFWNLVNFTGMIMGEEWYSLTYYDAKCLLLLCIKFMFDTY